MIKKAIFPCLIRFLSIWAFLLFTQGATANPITFDEPEATSVLWSSLPQFSIGGLTLTPQGALPVGNPYPFVTPRGTFDDRSPSPYSYDYISGNVLQVNSTEVLVDFGNPVGSFGFGAALNATSSPGLMTIQMFDSQQASLGLFSLTLDRTVLSLLGGTNSNSEGLFFVSGLSGASSALITSFGDGTANTSQFNWVIDNITFVSVPEPSTLIQLCTSLLGLGVLTRRFRSLA